MPLRLSEQGWNTAPPGTLEYLAVRFLKNHTTKTPKTPRTQRFLGK
jgi:hypothetical protein